MKDTSRTVKKKIAAQLISAVKKGSAEEVREMICAGAPLELKNGEGALTAAVLRDDPVIANMLLEAGADVNEIDPVTGRTPVCFAAGEGSLSMVSMLLDHGADPVIRDGMGVSPLYTAVLNNDFEITKTLLKKGALIDSPRLLLRAVENGSWDVTDLLVKAGACSDTKWAFCSLASAVQRGKTKMVKLMLEHGADPNICVPNSAVPLPIIIAAETGNAEMTELLLKHGADPNIMDGDGRHALTEAVSSKNIPIIKLLLDHGADLNVRDGSMKLRTPLCIAAGFFAEEIMQMLIDAGADVNKEDSTGITPLHYACRSGYPGNIHILLKAGADPNITDTFGNTVLADAIGKYGGEELYDFTNTYDMAVAPEEIISDDPVLALIRAGADINAKSSRQITPLMQSVLYNRRIYLKILIALGADIEATEINKRTVLHYAASWLNITEMKILLKAGADIDARDIEGRTPLDILRNKFPEEYNRHAEKLMALDSKRRRLGLEDSARGVITGYEFDI